jgi:hypothetical protein
MRIAGGRFKGRPLHAPSGRATRPTSDRVREAVFNVLAHGIEGFVLEDARVLDLCAGTGSAVARRPLRPLRRRGDGGPRRHPPQRRDARRHRPGQDLAPRRHQARPLRPARALPPRLHRPALRPGPGRSGAGPARHRRLARPRRRHRGRGVRSRHRRGTRWPRASRHPHLRRHPGPVPPRGLVPWISQSDLLGPDPSIHGRGCGAGAQPCGSSGQARGRHRKGKQTLRSGGNERSMRAPRLHPLSR